MNMALGQNRFRMRENRNTVVNKKLDFMCNDLVETSHEQPLQMRLDNSDSFSPCHTRSGTVYKPKTLNFGDFSHDRSSDSDSDSVFEEARLELKPLDGFDTEMSPIVRKTQLINSKKLSPCFLRRRQRTSTKILPSREIKFNNANINPYDSPVLKQRTKRHFSSSSASSLSSDYDSDDSGRCSPLPEKKLRVSDLSISRYEREFVQMSELASGQFGSVKLARHRLDGTDYAIKVNKTPLRPGSYDEKKAMNEVFAHASLNNDKHVVRYYNSWVEDGHVYIQTELCHGGSLGRAIEKRKEAEQDFTEEELRTVLLHTLKGLRYVHSKQMAHMDIKPENLFISIDQNILSSNTEVSSDSGAESDDPSSLMKKMDLKEELLSEESLTYKLGDLGHATSLLEDSLAPEEGDCRYMAPELFSMNVDRSNLPKADIFSLGLSLFEAASLQTLPRNSFDGELYEDIRAGRLPYLPKYSKKFNNLLASMVSPSPLERPSAAKLIKQLSVLNKKSELQLLKELKFSQQKLEELQYLVSQ